MTYALEICQDLLTYQRQLPLGVLRKNCSDKVCKIYRVTSAMDDFCSQNVTSYTIKLYYKHI